MKLPMMSVGALLAAACLTASGPAAATNYSMACFSAFPGEPGSDPREKGDK